MKNPGRKLYHSTVRFAGEKVVYVDPWQIEGEPHDADLILITHDHHDHFSPEDIEKLLKTDTIIAATPGCVMDFAVDMKYVEPDRTYVFCGLTVETVPAYNVGKPFHPKEKGYVGYIIMLGGVRCYVAGDTDITPENIQVCCDAAFVPCGGKYTMDAVQAAELVNRIEPQIAVPTHYGTVTDSSDAAQQFLTLVKPKVAVEIHN